MRYWPDSLRRASFNGVPFWVDYESLSGGKRLAKHEVAGGYVSETEELGLTTPGHDITAYVIGDDSSTYAIALRAVFDLPGKGALILPVDGLMMATVERYYRSRAKDRMGYIAFDISYVPQPVSATLGLSLGNLDSVVAAGFSAAQSALSGLF
ncbi:DNA circularization N-terminal domain-containing protein [Martelella sp. HB161492]|uniref:DNA circularization N-terminal domain-containing protein n=1 Tax=Martelella sp. HB161492 TaxID=2720726 RepID=UPI0015905FE8|nr:DNA circularization N-terminal domain-containing protein [Martelella sp. HB161492]